MMNIYKKLQRCRVDLQNSNLKKSGNNKFAGYQYFELGDFLPKINELMLENNLTSSICFMQDIAILKIIDCDKPEDTIEFSSPVANAQLKGCHDIQNLGAVQTYLRRYLWTNAMEIVEHDPLDATTGQHQDDNLFDTPQTKNDCISESQAKRLFALSKGNTHLVKEVLLSYNYTSSKDIKKSDYNSICEDISRKA
jgi:hypothetical protein